MKEFKYNENGVCENPNEIFRTTSKELHWKYKDQTPNSFTIKTARTSLGTWTYGFYLLGWGCMNIRPCAEDGFGDGTFENERAAINAAIQDMHKLMVYNEKHNPNDTVTAYDRKLKKLLAECRIEALQLSLF